MLSASRACSPYDPDLGGAPFLCGDAEPQVPRRLHLPERGQRQRAMSASRRTARSPIDAHDRQLRRRQPLEPNNTIQTAFQTPVATRRTTSTFAGLAICPAGDKDNYAITITVDGQNLEVLIEYEDGGAALSGVDPQRRRHRRSQRDRRSPA